MAGSIGSNRFDLSFRVMTQSPHTGETPLNRFEPSSSSPLSPSVELPRLTDRANTWRAKFSSELADKTAGADAATQAVNAWLQRRPALDSAEGLPLRDESGQPLGQVGGMIYRYEHNESEPDAARSEAFYTTVPGVLMAALTVHPSVEERTGLENPPAEHVALQLADPPIGLLSGVWQSAEGTAFHLHNNVMHRMGDDGKWTRHDLPGGSNTQLHMLGQQADGHVYAQAGSQVLRLVPGGTEPLGRAREGAAVRVDINGGAHVLHEGCLRPLKGGAPRPIVLLRDDGKGGLEPSPAKPKDFALDGNNRVVVLDHGGRLYQASPHGTGEIEAQRVELPLPGGNLDWAVTALGQGTDGSLQAIAQHREGQSVTLQRPAGAEAFEPAFTLNHPVLLVAREGLHAPADADIESRTQLDGHAELGLHGGAAYFRESPDQPWAALNGPDGKPLQNVESVMASPFGFVDRKPAFAVLREPGSETTTIVHLNLQGRTTFLPAAAPGSTPAGGPLTVVPAQVHAAPAVLLKHDGPIRDLAVSKERQAFFLEASATSVRILTTQGGAVHDLNADGALTPLSLALPLDNRPHVLDQQPDGTVKLKSLEDGAWKEMALDLSELDDGARMQQLRTSRTGQLEVLVGDAEGGGGAWHAVLPQMTVTGADGTKELAPARVTPLKVQEPESETGQNAGTNEIINKQQPSRLHIGNGDASVRTTLFGNLSTDPLTWTSQVQGLVTTTADHTKKILNSVSNMFVDTGRAFANSLGFTAMPQDQFDRLKGHFHEAQLAHAELGAVLHGEDGALTLEASFRQAYALGRPGEETELQVATLGQAFIASSEHAVEARIQSLESLVFDLRKIGIKERALDPSLDPKPDLFSATNASYKAADLWRSGAKMLGAGDDLLPGLRAAFDQVPDAAAPGVDPREHALLKQVRGLLHTLEAAGVSIPGAPGTEADSGVDDAQRDLRDPMAIRSANIARATVHYQRLLAVKDESDLTALQAAQQSSEASGLARLAKLGVSSWHDLEALDDIIATFRADMDDPKSARRQQLLKSMGLPPDAKRDEMAARMTDLLQDLYNRSTFFSVASDNKSVSVSVQDHRMQVLGFGSGPSVSGEHIHALGVERIGDSLEGDAGLVAFFVRHNKASMSLAMSKDIDINPSKEGDKEERSVQPFKEQLSKAAEGIASFSLASAGRLSVSAAMQHGQGAAVILSPETIPEFARLLFDAEHEDSTEVIAIGVNKGGIGLDLFETNLEAKGAITASANFSADPPGTFGEQKPLDPKKADAKEGPDNRRGNWTAGAGAALTADFGVHWNEMELHLDHAWKNILGLEHQGRFDFNTSLDANVNVNSTLSAAIGSVFKSMDSLALPNQSNLRLAGVNIGMGNGNFFDLVNPVLNGLQEVRNAVTGGDGQLSLAPGTYKRTLDAEVTQAIGRDQWEGMSAKLLKAFPEASGESLNFSDLAGSRLNRIDTLLARVQGQEALEIEQAAAPDDNTWQARARAATERAVASGDAWRPKSEAARTEVVNELKMMRQQETTALQQRAMLIPGARIELNMFGKGSLDGLVTDAVGHWHLGSKMGDLEEVKKQIPGLADVLKRIKDNSENIDQVRFVFEMRPQALRALNDAMELKRKRDEAENGGPPLTEAEENRLAMSWKDVTTAARSNPDLYRLAVIVPHNTDDNPSAANVGFLGFNHGRTATKSHQLFQSEVQLRYDMYDRLVGAEVLEGAGRAMNKDFEELQEAGVAPIAIPKPPLSDDHFAPPSPVGRRPG